MSLKFPWAKICSGTKNKTTNKTENTNTKTKQVSVLYLDELARYCVFTNYDGLVFFKFSSFVLCFHLCFPIMTYQSHNNKNLRFTPYLNSETKRIIIIHKIEHTRWLSAMPPQNSDKNDMQILNASNQRLPLC